MSICSVVSIVCRPASVGGMAAPDKIIVMFMRVFELINGPTVKLMDKAICKR